MTTLSGMRDIAAMCAATVVGVGGGIKMGELFVDPGNPDTPPNAVYEISKLGVMVIGLAASGQVVKGFVGGDAAQLFTLGMFMGGYQALKATSANIIEQIKAKVADQRAQS